ncbi:Uncharacterized protein HSBGL_1562 [Halapricum desulfuricans]|uniref:Twin-arginine translocation signal domain-containing protein n=1 Tax=Halapricum desulfuricans TaxID=2841257 RepID=A0A897NM75_9EURY|nr:twin-arginine translocation signal domain-containing protein [Halapricum desulfuricans]QSG11979.1 Uncharacterized protein HSBGL_1562 [Halapricum desulfuricans]
MRRRRFLTAAATGAVVGTAGCMGGEVVFSKNGTVNIPSGSGKVLELPPEGEEIEYTARDDRPFVVYVFEREDAVETYRAYVKDRDNDDMPSERPTGLDSLGGQAIKLQDDLYQSSTEERAREPLNADGTVYFVLDNSNYEDTVSAHSDPLSIQLDLKVVASSLPI